ncbi:hypothetical protein A2U01_0050202, partial [Trifolium medium]|nr:hypothetical protein [Trifolium medium]
ICVHFGCAPGSGGDTLPVFILVSCNACSMQRRIWFCVSISVIVSYSRVCDGSEGFQMLY